ncbi:MAG: hypothetical protein RL042_1867 [Nitrospirota bacterium]|jgi:hypothetical protein
MIKRENVGKKRREKFLFERLDTIGAADAEEDKLFLKACFVDTGDIEALRDCNNPKRIILGRTGSGKTALIQKLIESESRAIEIHPESLALSYISNSTILKFLSDLGVRLDVFYKLLWRHVFTVELLKCHFGIRDKQTKATFLAQIRNWFKDDKDKKALEYLETWGKSFWEETEYRVKELTTTLENDLKNAVSANISNFSLSSTEAQKITEQQKYEIVQRAQSVVNRVQVKELTEIIALLDRILDDPQKRYYITIDRLDEDWVEEKLRYKLIHALIDAVKEFRRVRHAKVIVAIRYDLLDRVYRHTRDTGFQEEKLESLYLPLVWTKERLLQIISERIRYLNETKRRSTPLTFSDIFPSKVLRQSALDYVLDRTLMRPRDAILFINIMITNATNKKSITPEIIRKAEGEYSRLRFRSLLQEWYATYPNLATFSDILKKRKTHFSVDDIGEEQCKEFCLEKIAKGTDEKDALSILAEQVLDLLLGYKDFRNALIQIFYRVGLVGLKIEAFEKTSWVITGRPDMSSSEIRDSTRVEVHPAFWRVLGLS